MNPTFKTRVKMSFASATGMNLGFNHVFINLWKWGLHLKSTLLKRKRHMECYYYGFLLNPSTVLLTWALSLTTTNFCTATPAPDKISLLWYSNKLRFRLGVDSCIINKNKTINDYDTLVIFSFQNVTLIPNWIDDFWTVVPLPGTRFCYRSLFFLR